MKLIEEMIGRIKEIKIEHLFGAVSGGHYSYVKEIRETETLIVTYLRGPLDSGTVPVVFMDFRGKLNRYLNKHILLDFGDVTDVDSATIANLIFLLNQLQQHHKKLALTHVSPALENYIDIDKVRSLIHVYGDEEEAVNALEAS